MKPSDNVKNQLLVGVQLQPDCAIAKSQSLPFARIEILNVPHDASQSCLLSLRILALIVVNHPVEVEELVDFSNYARQSVGIVVCCRHGLLTLRLPHLIPCSSKVHYYAMHG